ncbi:NAD-dependent epimerase/dehydratase family protein [Paractinoplanes durhamensis]|uniref:NDP-sugar dehydratase or epimerase n=1 Tax=Paractinoplanes durhamensis TaxID=113563 RepID=A0ABQ3ZBS5_9ACTN|nr:NAD-dependent epimerase/dehydratase family protein [Actinoplanes durhamensis]GIE07278.1 NDP-sugar dehydratase or epimerase [Actinoplanes durhamensis]
MSQTLLVTGGAGFVGANLIKALLIDYPTAAIVSLDNYFTGVPENHVNDPGVTYLEGSTVDLAKTWAERGLPSPEIVFHLGEYSRIVQSFDDHDLTWEFNLHGTKEVVKFASANGSKLIYAGSSSKFGNDGQDENLNPYAWTKAKNIEYIKNYANWYGLDYAITYFYNVYGPGQITAGRYATVIGIFEDHYRRGLPLPVVSPGTQTRDFTHVDDIVRGIVLVAQKGSGDGYLLGAGHEWPVLEVAKLFTTAYEMIPELRGERVRGQADITRAAELGWSPSVRLDDYVASFVATHTPGELAH